VKTGLDVLRDNHFKQLDGRRVGLMTNPSAVDARLDSAYKIFSQSPDVNLTALFGPEHGFAGVALDGETVNSTIDPRTNLPVYSLYGNSFRPTPEMLKAVDALVCDIQDIGVRYYTYTWTISHILEAAGEQGVEVVILDRPNPLGGAVVEGPLLDPSMSSLVGRFPVPVRHGMTLGELAQMINATWNPTPARITVIKMEGWQRDMAWDGPWVPPSPGIPHLSTLWHYPGACLIEGTTLSEGRGTALPFEIVGAPWIDPVDLAAHLNNNWVGVRFRPHTFRPAASKWRDEVCGGVQVYITDHWHPLEVWLGVIITIRAMYPAHFEWLPPESDLQHFDRLIGSTQVRQQIEEGLNAGKPVNTILSQIVAAWPDDVRTFKTQREPFLLYS
jgi:uncharacterized protein YbbC (DUF1343 family)